MSREEVAEEMEVGTSARVKNQMLRKESKKGQRRRVEEKREKEGTDLIPVEANSVTQTPPPAAAKGAP